MLNFNRDVDRIQHHNNVVAIALRNVKYQIVTSDKDKNAINNGKHVLFHLSKCSDKLHGNIVYKMQIEIKNFIQVPASLVFTAISEF